MFGVDVGFGPGTKSIHLIYLFIGMCVWNVCVAWPLHVHLGGE